MPNSGLRKRFHIDVFGRDPGRCIKWGLVVVSLAISVTQARAEYRVNVGDVLEVAVAGVPELRHRAAVQMDGSISLPLVGMLPVAGQPLSQIRAQVGSALASKVFRQRTPDGHENVISIDADEVTTIVAEYRPVYVNGDVSKPGEYPYRPTITARQLVAVAGGYDVMHMRMNNPYLESADLRSQYGSLWAEFAKEQARIWRIKRELGEDRSQAGPNVDVPLARSAIADIVNAEAEYLKSKQSDYRREKAFLERGIRQGDEEVGVLSEQQKQEEQGFQSDLDELQKVSDLYGKGTMTTNRVTDARRAVLLSATRKLQTAAQLMQVKKQQDELVRKLEKLDDQRRLELLRELQDTSVRLNEAREKLQSVGEKLQYTAMIRSQLVRGGGNEAEIAVIRKGERGQEERIVASEDTELQPGDAVEVTLRYHDGPDAPPRRPGSSGNSLEN